MSITESPPASPKSKIFTFLKFIIFFSLGIIIIWLSLRNLTPSEKQEIIRSFRTANYFWVIAVIFLGVIAHILRTLRWILFFEPLGYKPSRKTTFYAVMVGYFANLAFPRLGEVTRCGILAKYEKIPFNKGFGTVITERAFDMIVFFLLFLLMILTQIGTIRDYLDRNVYPQLKGKIANPLSDPKVIWGLVLFLLVFIVIFLLFRKKIIASRIFIKGKHLIIGFWDGLKSLAMIRRPFLFLFHTVLIWTLYFFMLYLCFYCFPATSRLSFGAGLSALVLGSVGIMITPGGIGLYPAIIQETLLLYGVANTTGLALGWIAWTAQTVMILIVGGLSLLLLSFNKNTHEKA